MGKKSERVYIDALTEEFELHGGSVETGGRGKHRQLILRAPDGRWVKHAVAGTPKLCDREMENIARQNARRYARQWGMTKGDSGVRQQV